MAMAGKACREGSQEPTYGFTAFANHPASCRRRNSDVGLQLHLFFGIKEVFFFQFPKDPSLSLKTRPVPEEKLVAGPAAGHATSPVLEGAGNLSDGC